VLDGTAPLATTLRLNAGGPAFAASSSRAFSADAYFTTSNLTTYAGGEVANTTDDELYRSGRFGDSFAYNLPTGNGTFDVVLHFNETYWGNGRSGGAGSRRFNVDAEGQRKLTDYDIFAKAGGAMRAVQETFRATVTDGTLNIAFLKGSADLARVEAIEVVPAATAAFYRAINLNGEAITLDGNAWAGKTATNYNTNGGSFVNSTTALVPSTDATRTAMIRSSVWRYTGLQLNLTSVPSGTYQVYLYMWEDNNPETFSISLEGRVVQANYNSGAAGTWKKLGPYQATITDGTINIATTGGAANFSGVEVWKVNTTARIAAGNAETEEWQVNLYPNPVTDKLTIQLPFSAEAVKATTVTDATGILRLINAHKAVRQNQLQIRTATLPDGLYIIHLDTDRGNRIMKFLKR
jgi:hypothetical protein